MSQALQRLFYFQFLTSWHQMTAVFLGSQHSRRWAAELGQLFTKVRSAPPLLTPDPGSGAKERKEGKKRGRRLSAAGRK